MRPIFPAMLLAAICLPVAAFAQTTPPQPQQQTPAPQRARPPAPQPPAARPAEPAPIFGLPRVGEEGATAEDVELLHRAARRFLADGRCSRIDYGDRSISRPGWFIISCDGRNIAFTRQDIDP